MNFWDRYEKLCLDSGYQPASEQAAKVLGTNRGTISAWKTNRTTPRTEYLVNIADSYGVSTDYLLCRTDDPTDYTNPAAVSAANIDDERKALILQNMAATPDTRTETATQAGNDLFAQLDETDQGKAEAYMQGLLAQDKYYNRRKKRA